MKNFILMLIISIMASAGAIAQEASTQTQPTKEDYERLIRASQNMEFRTYAIEKLGLTSEQIKGFDPLYRSYLRDKGDLAKRKYDLLDEFAEEMAEDDSPKNEENDRADFIENYWELEIAEMELKKDYFDRMEDKIGAANAFGFFLLEENQQNKIQNTIIERIYVPVLIDVKSTNDATGNVDLKVKSAPEEKDIMKQPINAKYRKDIDAFTNWVASGKGKVGLDHNYTHDGLTALSGAIVALARASNVDHTKMAAHHNKVVQLAGKLQEDRYSDRHADYAKEAFTIAAQMLRTVQKKGDFTTSSYAVTQVEEAAKKLDTSKLMTPQAAHIYAFFEQAQMAVNSMANSVSWATK